VNNQAITRNRPGRPALPPAERAAEADLRLYRAALMMEIACAASPSWPRPEEMRARINQALREAGTNRAMAYAEHIAALEGRPHRPGAARAWRRAVAGAIMQGPFAKG
jgi:hypothetical protein